MAAPYSGRCNCGAVTATIDAEPLWVRQCWCLQCQKAAAGGATNNALFPLDAIALEGEMGWFGYTAESGNRVEQGYCASCGTPIMGRNSGRAGSVVIRLGFLDQPTGLAPDMAIWLDDAPDWAIIDPALEQHRRQPPPPVPKLD